ncbi:MAG TPA: VOC family protein [Chloroflexota bacterium]|jgi:catechol 2,3-dioxygenase-like lactoylglutathione lyase family enzyme|nr:VOC family protein [Chloroflexota bacterium]
MKTNYLFAGLAVRDLATARKWYERFFGRPPDMIPNEREVVWRVAETGSLYVVVDPARAGRSLVTLIVDDLSATIALLNKRDMTVGPVERFAGNAKAVIVDPDGNTIALAEIGTPLEE